MGVCYLLANHTKQEYWSDGNKFSEMDYPEHHRKLFYLLVHIWDLRLAQNLEWISDLDDRYARIHEKYDDVEPLLTKDFDEWVASEDGEKPKKQVR